MPFTSRSCPVTLDKLYFIRRLISFNLFCEFINLRLLQSIRAEKYIPGYRCSTLMVHYQILVSLCPQLIIGGKTYFVLEVWWFEFDFERLPVLVDDSLAMCPNRFAERINLLMIYRGDDFEFSTAFIDSF